MAQKQFSTLAAAERLIVQSMTDAELDACIAANPDPELQAMLESMTDAEIDACIAGDTSPLVRRGWR